MKEGKFVIVLTRPPIAFTLRHVGLNRDESYYPLTVIARTILVLIVLHAVIVSSLVRCSSLSLAGDAAGDFHGEFAAGDEEIVMTDIMADEPVETAPPDTGITFVLSFITDTPDAEFLYVQRNDYDCYIGWLDVLSGETWIGLNFSCCTCDHCDSCLGCGACDTDVLRVTSGGNVTYEWDGVAYYQETCTTSEGYATPCLNAGVLAPGYYTARFCWGIGGLDAYPLGEIYNPECTEVSFAYPVEGGVVSYTVDRAG